MTKFEGCYLTNIGRSMVYDHGLANITFTKAVTGSGTYVSKDEIPELIELKEPKQEFGLDSLSQGESGAVGVKFKINNSGLAEGYQLSEVGIYARNDMEDEKLYCVAYALEGYTEEIPANDGTITYFMAVDIETVVSNDANVQIIYSEEHEWAKNYVDNAIADLATKKEVDALKKSVSDGKILVADAITDKGVTTATDATFEMMAHHIGQIQTGADTSDATAVAADILSGKTAYAKGEQITGVIPQRAGMTVDATATTQDDAYTYFNMPPGNYDANSKVRSANSNLSSISKIKIMGTRANQVHTITNTIPSDCEKGILMYAAATAWYNRHIPSFSGDGIIRVELIADPNANSGGADHRPGLDVWLYKVATVPGKSLTVSSGIPAKEASMAILLY